MPEALLELGCRGVGRLCAVEARDDLFREPHLDLARVTPRFDLLPPLPDRRGGLEGKQVDVAPHQRVGDRHQLAEHLLRRLGDADVVAERLRHLLPAIGALEQRHGDDALRLLAEILLQLAADQQVEFLIGAAELDVGLHRHRVVALHQRVQQLVHRDRVVAFESPIEVIAFKQAGERVACGEPDHPLGAELVRPFRVEQDLRFFGVQDLEYLVPVALRVGEDLLARERRPGLVLPRGVADHAGEVPDQELHLVAQLLEMPQLVDHHGVPQVEVGGRRVEPELDPQLAPARQLPGQLLLDDQLFASPAKGLNVLLNG